MQRYRSVIVGMAEEGARDAGLPLRGGHGRRAVPGVPAHRTVLLTPLLVLPIVLLAQGTVLARTIVCSGGECYGTRKADVITGTAGSDVIFAKGGKDQAFAGTGNDTVNGGGGNDRLFGEAGHNNLDGATGDDRLTGGPEFDALMGRDGGDTLDVSDQGGD